MMPKPRHVLLMPFGSIGDAVMLFALCVEIRTHEPSSTFTILVRRNAALIADLAAYYPYLTIVPITISPFGVSKLLWQLVRWPYVALMPGVFGRLSLPSVVFALLRLRSGTRTYGLLKNKVDAHIYTASLMYDSKVLHIDNLRRLARSAGCTVAKEGAPVSLEFDTRMPSGFPFAPSRYLVFHPFGSSSSKSFSPHRSRQLLLKLRERFSGLGIVVTGGIENELAAKQMIEGISQTITAAGLPILAAVGVIKGAALFIGVDTGTIHLASLMEQQVIALEHSASPEWLPLYNPNAIILTNKDHCTCDGVKNDTCVIWEEGKPYRRCLYEIPDKSILEHAAAKLHY